MNVHLNLHETHFSASHVRCDVARPAWPDPARLAVHATDARSSATDGG
jgi:hypothetical protein